MRKIIFFLFVSSWALLAQTNQGPIKVKSVTFADTSVQSSAGLPANGATSTGSGVANVVTFPGTVAAGAVVQARDVCYYKVGLTCGDGIHDDTATINAAFTALAASGGTLMFPAGTFLTSTGITPSQTSTACVNVDGLGSLVTTIKATAAMNGLYWRPGLVSAGTVDQSRCHIRGIMFDGNNLALTGMNNAGTPGMDYADLVFKNAVPNTTDNTNAQFIVGANPTNGLANGQGDDYESRFSHIQILPPGLTATAPYQMIAKQTLSDDGGADDIVILGDVGGTSGTPNTILQAGILITAGQGRSWKNVHCYPASQYAPFPTCIVDQAGTQTFIETEGDGMTNYAIDFQSTGSIATDTKIFYGGTGTPAQTWTNSYGFHATTPYTNSVSGVSCYGYGGAVLTSWKLYSSSSSQIFSSIPVQSPNCGPGATTGTVLPANSNTYLLTSYGANTYVKLGTWVATSSGESLQIHFNGGNAYGSGGNTQGVADLIVEVGNYTGTNIDGISSWAFGNTALQKAFAIGTGNTNLLSWDIWVFVSSYSPVSYTVSPTSPLASWTNTNTTTQTTAPTGTYIVSAYTNYVSAYDGSLYVGQAKVIPGTTTGYHGTNGTKVQMSDNTGASQPAFLDANGNITGSAFYGHLLANCGTMTTTAAATNTLACSWVTTSSNCTATQNSTTTIVPWTAIVPTAGTVTITHTATAGGTYAIACSVN